jgi:hypothetical protein
MLKMRADRRCATSPALPDRSASTGAKLATLPVTGSADLAGLKAARLDNRAALPTIVVNLAPLGKKGQSDGLRQTSSIDIAVVQHRHGVACARGFVLGGGYRGRQRRYQTPGASGQGLKIRGAVTPGGPYVTRCAGSSASVSTGLFPESFTFRQIGRLEALHQARTQPRKPRRRRQGSPCLTPVVRRLGWNDGFLAPQSRRSSRSGECR